MPNAAKVGLRYSKMAPLPDEHAYTAAAPFVPFSQQQDGDVQP